MDDPLKNHVIKNVSLYLETETNTGIKTECGM